MAIVQPDAGSTARGRKPGRNKLMLGLFSANCSGGMSITTIPERWDGSWENNLALAIMADEAGLDFLLPVARWRGYGGQRNFQGDVLETITWATGLLASTRNISVFATAHTAFMHPIVAAKQFATADRIGRGRFGLNVVFGWNKPEYEMFGVNLPTENRARYEYGEEWFEVVTKLWQSEEPFDYNGKYFHLKGAIGSPKPVSGRVPIFNAGFSPDGRNFAARSADFLLTTLYEIEKGRDDVAQIRELARSRYNRDIGVVATSYVVCRRTNKEANDYHDYYANENADWEAVDALMELLGLHRKSIPPEVFTKYRLRYAGGHGTYPLVGDPDHIADELERISGAGFVGDALVFVNYLQDLPLFRDEVLPRLERKGLRVPSAIAVDA